MIEVELVQMILYRGDFSRNSAPMPPFAQCGFQARFDGVLIGIVQECISECFDRDFKIT